MRQLIITVPRGRGASVLDLANPLGGTNAVVIEGETEAKQIDCVIVHVSNARVEALLGRLEELPDLHVTLAPHGVIALGPPPDQAPRQATDVEPRSPVEIFLGGLQSVGSWKGFLGYAAAAGVVVWIGLYTETVYLLTAAMLIAPYAGPAMNAALATARGDASLFGRSLGRYFAGLALTVAVSFALSVLLQQEIATELMVDTSFLPSVAVLLPLAAGAAGALNLCQADRDSLVSGAATGMLVAASLAPPAGLVGMGAAIGEWEMVGSAAFVLFLQVVGINVSGAVVFRLYGISPTGIRFARGRTWVSGAAWIGSLAITAGLIGWQLADAPRLQRSSIAQRANADVQQVVEASGLAQLVQADVRFTRARIPDQETMLATVYVQVDRGEKHQIRDNLTAALKRHLAAEYEAIPLIDVTVLEK